MITPAPFSSQGPPRSPDNYFNFHSALSHGIKVIYNNFLHAFLLRGSRYFLERMVGNLKSTAGGCSSVWFYLISISTWQLWKLLFSILKSFFFHFLPLFLCVLIFICGEGQQEGYNLRKAEVK